MQTFLPYSDFRESAEALDKQHCWKQVVEASQIIQVLEGKQTAWRNHPAVKMWEGYIPALKKYFNVFLDTCIVKHNINTKYQPFLIDKKEIKFPWWLGNEDFHRAMRPRLIQKQPNFYLPLWKEDNRFNNSKYFWPVNETKTFRTI